jgi:aryl-alcohol dehydrogenase-like predicted oxidoreductase
VRHIGVSNFDADQLRRAEQIAPVETLGSPSGSRRLLSTAVLADRARHRARDTPLHPNEPQLSRNLELGERLRSVADRHETTPGAVAVAWTLHNRAVDGAIVGFRRPDQVDPILTAANLELTDEDTAEIEGGTR